MAALVNIRRDVDDKFYRYKMPLLVIRGEGRGNGVKTLLVNMADVAKALNRPPTYPTKYFGIELGSQTTFSNDRYIVNGTHQADRLQELLDTFIKGFILCNSCLNPETEYIITTGRNENIEKDCKACGSHTPVDMRHKLSSYIIKNQPAPAKGKKKKDKYAEAAEARDAQLTGANVPTIETNRSSPTEDKPPILPVNTIANDDWAADTSAEAVAARMQNLAVNIEGFGGGLGGDDDEEEGGPYAAFGAWLEENKATATDAEIAAKAKELEVWQKHKACVALGENLWTDDIVGEVGKWVKVLKVMTTTEKCQKSLLGGLEKYWSTRLLTVGTAVPKVLMQLYQADVLDEEVIQQWGTHVSKKYVDKEHSKTIRKASEPFLKWLEEAEDDEDDEDDEDEE